MCIRDRVREVHVDDLLHRLGLGELDVVEEAAAQKGVGQLPVSYTHLTLPTSDLV